MSALGREDTSSGPIRTKLLIFILKVCPGHNYLFRRISVDEDTWPVPTLVKGSPVSHFSRLRRSFIDPDSFVRDMVKKVSTSHFWKEEDFPSQSRF